MGYASDLYKNLVKVPCPVAMGAHRVEALTADLNGEHRTEPVPPVPYSLMADLDPRLCSRSSTFRSDSGNRM